METLNDIALSHPKAFLALLIASAMIGATMLAGFGFFVLLDGKKTGKDPTIDKDA
jgi:hypothetical protein